MPDSVKISSILQSSVQVTPPLILGNIKFVSLSGIKAFEPWMKKVEQKIIEGLVQPKSLIESCEVLGICKVTF